MIDITVRKRARISTDPLPISAEYFFVGKQKGISHVNVSSVLNHLEGEERLLHERAEDLCRYMTTKVYGKVMTREMFYAVNQELRQRAGYITLGSIFLTNVCFSKITSLQGDRQQGCMAAGFSITSLRGRA